MNKSQARKSIKKIVKKYTYDFQHFKDDHLTEHDLQRNYILPMLEALNWDIYDLGRVRQEKFISDIEPDIYLVDEAGNVICIEVKPDYQPLNPESNLQKYTVERVQRLKTRVVWLTSFKDSQLYIFSEKKKNKPTVKDMTFTQYYSNFDTLWKYLSNTRKGIATRAALKARVTRS